MRDAMNDSSRPVPAEPDWTEGPDAYSASFGEPADEVIHAYSRADGLADGVLVAVDAALSADAGFRVPVALTAAAWADCVAWDEADDERKGTYQDVTGRLWDVLIMAAVSMRGSRAHRREFELYRVPRPGLARKARPVRLVVVIGPGDSGEPVVTIMQPHED